MHAGTLEDKYTLPRGAWERERIQISVSLVPTVSVEMHAGTLEDKYTLPRGAWEREKAGIHN